MPAQTGGKRAQVAKPRPGQPSRPPRAAAAATPGGDPGSLRPKAVIDELRKVVWPGLDELTRMTGIVIVTVFLFAGIIGIADWGLAYGVGKIYNTSPNGSPSPTLSPH